MEGLINYLRGSLRVCVTGAAPEQLLNLLTKHQIRFWKLRREDELHLHFCLLRRDQHALEQLALRSFCTVEVEERRGAYFYLMRLLHRPVLLTGMLLAVAACFVLESFVVIVTVDGNQQLHEEEILRALEELDIGFGTPGSSIDQQLTKHRMLNLLPQLSWIGVNRTGCRLNVLVTERKEPEKNETYTAAHVVASRTGLLREIQVFEGMQVCELGQTVRQGQVLVSGLEDYGQLVRMVGAQAEIYAETWYSGTMLTPAIRQEKVYTGEEYQKISLILGRKRINLSGNSSFLQGECDKIVTVKKLTLPDGYELPAALEIETYRVYTIRETAVPEEEAGEITETAWKTQLLQNMIAGKIQSTQTSLLCSGEWYALQAESTCIEMIARVLPITTLDEDIMP